MDKIINAARRLLVDFGKMPQVSQYIVAVVLVLFAFNAGQCNSESKLANFRQQFVALQNEAKVTKQFADSANAEVDRLMTESKSKDERIAKLSLTVSFNKEKGKSLKTSLVSLEANLAMTPAPDSISIQRDIIGNLKEQVVLAEETIVKQQEIITEQQFKITKLDSAVALATVRGDSLQTVVTKLINLPKPPRPWISKKTAGMIAFVTGVVVGDQLARR